MEEIQGVDHGVIIMKLAFSFKIYHPELKKLGINEPLEICR